MKGEATNHVVSQTLLNASMNRSELLSFDLLQRLRRSLTDLGSQPVVFEESGAAVYE